MSRCEWWQEIVLRVKDSRETNIRGRGWADLARADSRHDESRST